MSIKQTVVMSFENEEITVIAMAVDHYRSCCIQHAFETGPGKDREWFRWEADYLAELLLRIQSNINKP